MKAVILAAGLGTRMGTLTEEKPKGLIKIAGREILYRTMKILETEGIEEFIIVTNPKYKEKLKEFLEKNNFKHTLLLNPYPERGNGYSLYLARKYVSERFILVMSDHVYEEEFIKEALKGRGAIVDKEGKFINKEEATKVRINENRVVDIGKKLKKYDAVDTGFFIFEPRIFKTIEEISKEKESFELVEIIKRAKPKVTEVNGFFWMDIDTPQDIKKARKLLITKAVKNRGEGIISRHINRKISTKISEVLVDYVEPMHMTVFSFLVGVLAGIVALFSPPIAGIFYQLNSILDGVDGEIARAAMKKSRFGGYFDSILDRYVDFFVLLGLAIYMKPGIWMWGIISLALFGSFMVSYSTERYKGEYFADIYKSTPQMKYLLGKRDERVFLTMIFSLVNQLRLLFMLLAVITHVRVFATIYFVWRRQKT